MAVDVSRIPNNNKFDPVREAILQLQEDIQAEGQIAYDGEITVGKVTGSTITVTGGSFTVNQSNNTTISIGIDDSGYYSTSGGEIDGNVDITGNLVVEGNLTVSGATITKLSEEVLIEDNIIVLNSNETGTPSLNSGIEIERGTSPNVDFLWNETSNEWDLQTYSGARIYRYGVGSTVLTIEAGSTAGDAVLALTPNTTGTGGVIKTTNAKDIAFQPNSTTKMVIASGGDVNIYDSLAVGKTSAPSYELDVDGDGYFTGDVTATTFIGDLTGNADTASTATNADTVDNKHATDFTLDYVTDNGAITSNNITVGRGSFTGASSTVDSIQLYNTDNNYSYLRQTSATNGNNLWIDTTLGADLWLNWDNPGQDRTAGVYSDVWLGTGRGTASESVRIYQANIEGRNSAGTVTYKISPDGSSLFNGGFVGIGINPSFKLDVFSSDSYEARFAGSGAIILRGNNASGFPGLLIKEGTTNKWNIRHNNADEYLYFYDYTANQTVLKFENNGDTVFTPANDFVIQDAILVNNTNPTTHSNYNWYSYDDATNAVNVFDINSLYFKRTATGSGYDEWVYYPETVGLNFDISFKLTLTQNAGYRHFGIAIAGDGTNTTSNFDYIVLRDNITDANLRQVRIDVAGTSESSYASSSLPSFADGTERHILIQVRNKTYLIEVDGVVVHEFTASARTNNRGKVGFCIYEGNEDDNYAYVRQFKIEQYSDDGKILIAGTTNNLIVEETTDGEWHIYDTFQDNGIIINSSTGGMEFQYNGTTEMTIDANGVSVVGGIDLSDANLDIGSADIVFGIDATDTGARGLVWNFDADGNGTASNIGYIRSGGTLVGEVMQFNMNAEGTVTGSDPIYEFKNGGTDVVTIGADGTINIGTEEVATQSWVDTNTLNQTEGDARYAPKSAYDVYGTGYGWLMRDYDGSTNRLRMYYDDGDKAMRFYSYHGTDGDAHIALYHNSSFVTFGGDNINNWNTAYGWGNHASAGYLTSTLNQKITLTDNAYFVGSSSYGFRFNSNNDAYNNVIMYDSGDMYVRGNVGIGKAAGKRLDIKTNTTSGQGGTVKLDRGADRATHQAYYIIESNNYTDELYLGVSANTSDVTFGARHGSISFQTGAYSTRMVIDTSGNLSIGGTHTAAGIIDVQTGNTGQQLVRLWNTDTSGTGSSVLRIANSGNNHNGAQLQFTDATYYVATLTGDRDNGLRFYTGYQNSPNDNLRMELTNAGKLGIGGAGYAQADKQLTFKQAADDAIQIRRTTTSQGNPAVGTGISWTWDSATTHSQTWAAIRAIMPGNGNTHLTFSTRNTSAQFREVMRVTDSGRVGIMEDNPSATLQSSGTFRATGHSYFDYRTTFGGTNNAWTTILINKPLGDGSLNSGVAIAFEGTDYGEMGYRLKANGANYYQVLYNGSAINWKHFDGSNYTPRMTITNDGNFGLNASSPLTAVTNNPGMQINRGGHSTILLSNGTSHGGVIQTSDNARRVVIGANFRDDVTNSWGKFVAGQPYGAVDVYGISGGGAVHLLVGDGNDTTYSSSANQYFSVYKSTTDSFVRMRTRGGQGFILDNSARVTINDLSVQSGAGNDIRIGDGFGTGGSATIHNYLNDLYLQYGNGSTTTNLHLGGGGTQCDLRLDTGKGRLLMNRDGKSGSAIDLQHVENGTWPFIFYSSGVGNDNPSGFWINGDGTPDMRLRAFDSTVKALIHSNGTSFINGGDLAVGKTSASYKLDVNGTIRAEGDVIAYSDARIKENVKTIDNALEKVKQLRGVSYNKIGETDEKIGVIAQEIEKVLPQVVQDDAQGMKSVAYGNIVGVLIEAIKEQQKQIDELKSIINGSS